MTIDLVFVASGDTARDRARLHRSLSGAEPCDYCIFMVGGLPDLHAHVQEFQVVEIVKVPIVEGGLVSAVGKAILLGHNDVLVLGSHVSLAPEAAKRLARGLSDHDRNGFAVPGYCEGADSSAVDDATERLPRSTGALVPDTNCVLVRRDVLAIIGALDFSFTRLDEALVDLVLRGLRCGFSTLRSPSATAMVDSASSASVPTSHQLEARHYGWPWLRQRALDDYNHHTTSHAINARRGKVRVCLDLRSLPEGAINGTGVYSVELARALLTHTSLSLSILTETEGQRALLKPLGVPVYLEQETLPTVEVIHRPAQVFKGPHLRLLMRSTGAFVITYQDLIAYRAPSTHQHPADFETYKVVSRLAVRGAQGLIAISEHNKTDIAKEFDIDADNVKVVYHGVEHGWFGTRITNDNENALRQLEMEGPFVLSVGSDYAHKNLRMLLAAYAQFRARWGRAESIPHLAIVGHPSGTSDGVFRELREARIEGVRYFGGVDNLQMRALFQEALALVYPSVFEGFGLPPLEAMAAGTPVICSQFTSLPEVTGDAAFFVPSLTDAALTAAMLQVSQDTSLRESLRGRGRARAAAFSWKKTAEGTAEVYLRALQSPSAQSLKERAMASLLSERLFG